MEEFLDLFIVQKLKEKRKTWKNYFQIEFSFET